MGCHTRNGSLPVCTRHANRITRPCNFTQQLRPLDNGKVSFLEISQLAMRRRDGRSKHNQRRFFVGKLRWNGSGVIFIMNERPLLAQQLRKFGLCPVVPSHSLPFGKKISSQVAHSNSPNPYKIDRFIFHHQTILIKKTSLCQPLNVRSAFRAHQQFVRQSRVAPASRYFRSVAAVVRHFAPVPKPRRKARRMPIYLTPSRQHPSRPVLGHFSFGDPLPRWARAPRLPLFEGD